MRIIHFIIISLSLSLQNYSIFAEQYHPLAKLWNVDDSEVPKLLELERKLITIDEILKLILENDEFLSSFVGSFINIFKTNRVIVNTVNFSKVNDLLALPQISPYVEFLNFTIANKSMSQIQSNFREISHQTNIIQPKDLYIYTDMENNINVIFLLDSEFNNTEFINAIKPFNPKIIHSGDHNNLHVSQNLAQSRRDIKVKVLDLIDPYDFAAILLEGDDVTPTFSIRNDDADQYKELIITDGAPVSSHGVHISLGNEGSTYRLIVTDMTSNIGDRGGPLLSFVSPENLHSVMVHGTIVTAGTGVQLPNR
ncbi:hypothetical protein F8M41_003454 [Gigaspora margarita]|uniref:Uncharacterized protein n=1 Tax=Gigaspora margarita TaxID=4874 RepID=A0A8H4ES56_GIGMA|nr:hypothetical protein F8M41_003454 [Gigaspora margarita]